MLSQSDLTEHGLEVLLELLPNQVLLGLVQGHQAIDLAGVLLPHQRGHSLAIGSLHRLASSNGLRSILGE